MTAVASTLEALAFQLRGGVNALRETSALRRLGEFDEHRMKEIAQRLTKPRWNKAGDGRVPPWSADEIETFFEVWSLLR
jgi:hypothetical protein